MAQNGKKIIAVITGEGELIIRQISVKTNSLEWINKHFNESNIQWSEIESIDIKGLTISV